ncbi:hypothetical protein C8N43_1460 [Litoreibacter ponti]|uniref:Uncharacterized protein n=1 Tax=Litoreibacter ponti TaxID=1510457 RepID=A0A2T6BL73_9RHOB|nr:hypothetical protein [Litoreibacter ponti]PTX56797.1 hypothetical protein C8N43_1460 [Litoreibacter ponti]
MRLLLIFCLLLTTAAQAACPPNPERSARHTELMALLADAPNETVAREYSNELWNIWGTAPDTTAQEILQRGMERRQAFDLRGALEDFNTLIDYCPGYAEGYNQRAFINFIGRDYEIALEDLDRALAITPDHIGALTGRALALIQLGRDREGQLVLREALKLNPWLPERNRVTPLPPVPQETVPEVEL